MNIHQGKRENEEILMKLDRVLGFCSNCKESIETMIGKYSQNLDLYTELNMKEDLKVVATNLDAIMNFIDPIFKHYLILPATSENENCKLYFKIIFYLKFLIYSTTLPQYKKK
jgi:transcription elongation factor Elf1